MRLNEYAGFVEVDTEFNYEARVEIYDSIDIPQYIIDIENEYDQLMEEQNYVLAQGEYDRFTAKWARVHDWFSMKRSQSEYLVALIESQIEEMKTQGRIEAPQQRKSLRDKERWLEETNTEFSKLKKLLPRAKGYHGFFINKLESVKIKHYNCKSMSRSIDGDRGIESHP